MIFYTLYILIFIVQFGRLDSSRVNNKVLQKLKEVESFLAKFVWFFKRFFSTSFVNLVAPSYS